jgi:DNA primase
MSIQDCVIAEIKAANDIVEVVNEYLKLTKENSYSGWLTGKCPFHEEKESSFKVNKKTQSWHCFGCGAGSKKDGHGSDVIAFIQQIDKLSFFEAVKKLGNRIGIEIEIDKPDPAIEIMKDITTEHNRRYYNNLWSSSSEANSALSYLHNRGLTDDTIIDRRLGLVPIDEMKNRMDITGISGRISIAIVDHKPTTDPKGPKTIGMAYRDPGLATDPKYKNDATSVSFQKSKILYGLDKAQNHIKSQGFGILVECYFGTMMLYQEGIKNVVSTMGTSITEEQVRLMKRYSKNWTILFDGDDAGNKSAVNSLELFLKYGIQVKFAQLPIGEDPDTFIQRIGTTKFEQWLKTTSKPLMNYIVNEELEKFESAMIALKTSTLSKLSNVIEHLGNSLTIEDEILLDLIQKRIR